MKEFSIEEKARAYDKALGKAEDALNDGTISNNTIAYLQDIFPELKESEDEKIRKTLIRFHKSTIDVDGIKGEDIIAWLEKQGEQNLIMAKSPQLGEQKTTDKVESKFKVGDWVIDRQDIVHQIANVIENVTNHTYGYDIVGGGYFNDNVEGVRLWTIQDAKDGDVLVTKKGNLFIYDKNRYDNGLAYYYVGLVNKELTIKGPHNMLGHFGELHSVFPATKDQHDTLLKAMADAGYTFDFEKKELKKIENTRPMLSDFFKSEYERGKKDAIKELKKIESQYSQWNISDFRTWQYIVSDVLTKRDGIGQYLDDGFCKKIAQYMQEEWSKKLSFEQNPSWSEEDNMMIEETLYFLREYQHSNRCKDENGMQNSVTCEKWLKSLKQRIGK